MWKTTTQRVRLVWSDAVDIQERAARGTCGALAVSSTENGEETEETEEEEEARCCISSLYQPGEGRWMEDEIDGLSEGRWWWCGRVRERVGWWWGTKACSLSPSLSLSVPAHISSRRAGMRRGHSEPITKLIK